MSNMFKTFETCLECLRGHVQVHIIQSVKKGIQLFVLLKRINGLLVLHRISLSYLYKDDSYTIMFARCFNNLSTDYVGDIYAQDITWDDHCSWQNYVDIFCRAAQQNST